MAHPRFASGVSFSRPAMLSPLLIRFMKLPRLGKQFVFYGLRLLQGVKNFSNYLGSPRLLFFLEYLTNTKNL